MQRLYWICTGLIPISFLVTTGHLCVLSEGVEGFGAMGLVPYVALVLAIAALGLVLGLLASIGMAEHYRPPPLLLALSVILLIAPAIYMTAIPYIREHNPKFTICSPYWFLNQPRTPTPLYVYRCGQIFPRFVEPLGAKRFNETRYKVPHYTVM